MLGCYNINLQLNYVGGTHKRGNTENVKEKCLKNIFRLLLRIWYAHSSWDMHCRGTGPGGIIFGKRVVQTYDGKKLLSVQVILR